MGNECRRNWVTKTRLFSLIFFLCHCTVCGLGDFLLVLFFSLFRVRGRRTFWFGKMCPINAACHESLVPGDLVLHGSFLPQKMLVDAPESSHVHFLLMAFIWSDNHLISHGFM